MCVPEEEREQVERLRWPSRGYLQELSEYQQRRRKLRKSRCIVMWPPPGRQRPVQNRGRGERRRRQLKDKMMTKSETAHQHAGKQRKHFFLYCWMRGWLWGDTTAEEDSVRLNQQDSVVCDTPLLPWRNMCVLCIMTVHHEQHKKTDPLNPIWIKMTVWPPARSSAKDYISISWCKMVDFEDEHWHKMAPLQVEIYQMTTHLLDNHDQDYMQTVSNSSNR